MLWATTSSSGIAADSGADNASNDQNCVRRIHRTYDDAAQVAAGCQVETMAFARWQRDKTPTARRGSAPGVNSSETAGPIRDSCRARPDCPASQLNCKNSTRTLFRLGQRTSEAVFSHTERDDELPDRRGPPGPGRHGALADERGVLDLAALANLRILRFTWGVVPVAWSR
jgi:hypothetical protein